MKRLTLLFVVAMVVLFSAPARAEVPECVLGGPTAMDTNRQLAEGETFVITDRPLVVNLRFKPTEKHPESVGECKLPSGSKVAEKNGILQWVKKCGNDEVNRNIWLTPLVIRDGIDGYTPVKGKDYFDGKNGYTPVKGKDYRDGIDGRDAVSWQGAILEEEPPPPAEKKGWWARHWLGALIVGILTVVVIAVASSGGGDDGGGTDRSSSPPDNGPPDNGGGQPPIVVTH